MSHKVGFSLLTKFASENRIFLTYNIIFDRFSSMILHGFLYHVRLVRKCLYVSRHVLHLVRNIIAYHFEFQKHQKICTTIERA
eukprot:UN28224